MVIRILLALFSFMPVFSASSNLAYLGMEQEILWVIW
jgi:hypothetical protein